jgi:hypothetical protein
MKRGLLFVWALAAAISARSVSSAQAAEGGAGDAEPALAVTGSEAPYVRALHARVHARWADSFLAMAGAQLPKTHPLNDPGLRVVLEVSVARDGSPGIVRVKEPSGVADFDGAAVEVLRDSLPLPGAPEQVLSDDDRVHFVWALARDHRRCADVKVVNNESPLDEALPRLLAKDREGEGLRRARVAAATAPERAASLFAMAWLKRALALPALAPRAAAALLIAGDRSGEAVVRQALERSDRSESAGAALARAKLPVCEQVKDRLGQAGSKEQAAAVAALRASGEAACAPGLIAVAQSRALPTALRVAAIEALGAISDPAVKKALGELEKEGAVALRAAAIVAAATPGSGRAALFRLTPLLRDPALDVRVAAITGLLRAVGEASLDQLYLVYLEKDARPYEAAAVGLGRLGSEASAALLVRMLHKEDRRVRVAGAAALAARSDTFARKALELVRKDQAAEVRVFAASLMDDNDRHEVVAALTVKGAEATRLYQALAAGSARAAAADWLLANFASAQPTTKLDLLGAWVAVVGASSRVAAAP